jgi:YidC/Oxa1 family membrane protein insertase
MINIFDIYLYQPLLKFLLFLYSITGNFGLTVIILTVLIKLLLNPLNKRALESQKMMAEIQPRIKEIQKKYKDKEQQGREMLKLYKETKFNPFSGIFLLFLQIPILYALFMVFKSTLPATVNPMFFSVNLSQPNMYLAIITAIAQYFQAKTAQSPIKKQEGGEKDQMEQISETMQKQMVLFIPAITFFVLFNLPSALGLYWLITTVLNTIQQRQIFKDK